MSISPPNLYLGLLAGPLSKPSLNLQEVLQVSNFRHQSAGCDPRPRDVAHCKDNKKLVLIKTRMIRRGKRCVRVRYRVKVRRIGECVWDFTLARGEVNFGFVVPVCKRSTKVVVCRGKVKIIKILLRSVHKCSCKEVLKIVKGQCSESEQNPCQRRH